MKLATFELKLNHTSTCHGSRVLVRSQAWEPDITREITRRRRLGYSSTS